MSHIRTQRELLPCIEVGVIEENKIKPTIVIPTEVRLVFPKLKSIEFAGIIFAPDLNGYEVFFIQLVDIQDLCGDMSHSCYLLRNEFRPGDSVSHILFCGRLTLPQDMGEDDLSRISGVKRPDDVGACAPGHAV